jgi:hypothetical protein
MSVPGSDPDASGWQAALQRYLDGLSPAEREDLHARALRSLDRATRARRLELPELARLSALSRYLTPRIERQTGAQPAPTEAAVLMGLIAGYQLAAGEAEPLAPDPFGDE